MRRCPTASESRALFDFSGQVALVTGASRGIGAATARLLGASGAKVYVNYVTSEARAEDVVAGIRDAGGQAEKARFDVSDPAQVAAGIAAILEREEEIALLVNNAGVRFDGLTHGMAPETWDECTRMNLDSAFYVTKEIVRPMLKHQRGSIVYVSSIAGSIGSFGQSAYAASKAGIVALAKSVALEYGANLVHFHIHIGSSSADREVAVDRQRHAISNIGGKLENVADFFLFAHSGFLRLDGGRHRTACGSR